MGDGEVKTDYRDMGKSELEIRDPLRQMLLLLKASRIG